MLSVVVPVYNAESYLEKCINSIVNQRYNDIEIILVDDGSTDSSSGMCDAAMLNDSRIKVIHKKHQGLIDARISGVENASNDYVTFVDADDFVAVNSYNRLVPLLKEYNPDLVCTNEIIWFDDDHYMKVDISMREGLYDKEQIKDNIIPDMFGRSKDNSGLIRAGLWSKIFRTDLLLDEYRNISGQSFFVGEDVAIIYPYILRCKTLFVSGINYYYYRQIPIGQVKGCFTRTDYFDQLYSLYNYLKNRFSLSEHNSILMKQLDYFYIHMVDNYRMKYEGSFDSFTEYKLPNFQIPKRSKVVLYGAGNVGRQYHKEIMDNQLYDIVAWIDKDADNIDDPRIKSPNIIGKIQFEFVIIAVKNKESVSQIKSYLHKFEIEEKNIITGVL